MSAFGEKASLRVQLLGGLNIVFRDVPIIGVNSARLQSLLVFLILHADTPQSRPHCAFLLWPDTTETQARNNLRQLLYQLRQALPDSDRFLRVDTNTVFWQTDPDQAIDLHDFGRFLREAHAAEQRGDLTDCRHKLEAALSLYQGDLVPGCYDDWVTPEREHVRQQYSDACQKLMLLLETQRAYAEAIPIAQRLHRLDPLDENVSVALIRLHGLNDDLAGARRAYQIAVDALRRELDAEPGDALQEAYQRLQRISRAPALSEDDKPTGSGRLIGRQAEWQHLQMSWQRAIGEGARLCLIVGEAGIGKSRLAEEAFHWVTRQGCAAAHTRSYGVEGNLSLAPVTEWLRSRALRPHWGALDPIWLTEIARLLPEILTEHPHLARPEPISEYGLRPRFFEALARGVLASPFPLLLWIDDLQWCDQETLEWLHFLLRFEPRSPILILGTVRREETSPDHPLSALTRQLQGDARVDMIELAPLDAAETAKLASQIRGHALDSGEIVRLYQETEGNPLFVVETIRAGLPPAASVSPSTPTEASRMPPRVQAIIAGRLVQLSPAARAVAEIGAAIGRAFTLDLLLRSGRENEETATDALDELWQRRIVREHSANLFDFTHDKLREVTYAETGLSQRRLLHRRIAQALEALNAETLDSISAQIAAHYEKAGLFDQAIPYYQRAGSVASSVYANEDAIHLFLRGLALLEQQPESAQRDALELNIQLALATLYRISKGWASLEEERVMQRVMVLSDKVGNVEQRIRTFFAMQALFLVQGHYDQVERFYTLTENLYREAQSAPTPFSAIYLAGAKAFQGQLVESRTLFDKIVAVHSSAQIQDIQESHGLNYRVHGLAWNAHGIWCLGYPDQAAASAHKAVELAREFQQPFTQALAITYLAMLQHWQADFQTFLVQAEDACTLTLEYQAPYYHAWANVLVCFAQAELRPDAERIACLHSAIHRFTETGARVRLPIYFSLVAQVYLKAGRWEDGLHALEQAWAESRQNNEHWWDAELHRWRGELRWAQGANFDEIETEFQQALEIARSQQAKSLQLRAAISLARLRQAQGRASEAKQGLIQVYEWFKEGFETPDLKMAQALIAQLEKRISS